MSRQSLTLLHTSDLHIGSDIYPDAALSGFYSVLRVARERSVDAVLIAGDLFDNRGVPPALLGEVFRELAALERPVVVLPGNHDTALLNGSFDPDGLPDGVSLLLQQSGATVSFVSLGLSVWGRPVYNHSPAFRPMGGLGPRPDGGWYVGMAHGLVTEFDPYGEYSSKISPGDLAAADCDYVALGHVHVFRDVTAPGGAPAFYSGAPSGGRSPTAAIVSMNPSASVTVEAVSLKR